MKLTNFHLKRTVEVLNSGGIISYPSDTIAALGTLPIFEQNLAQIINLKKRNPNKGLILLGSVLSQFYDFVEATEINQLENYLKIQTDNEATTFLLKANQNLPQSIASLLMGNYQKLAIRITQHNHIKQLCEKLNLPIVSTSLNLTQRNTLYRNYQVRKFFAHLDYYLAIQPSLFGPSKIVDFETNQVIRPAFNKI